MTKAIQHKLFTQTTLLEYNYYALYVHHPKVYCICALWNQLIFFLFSRYGYFLGEAADLEQQITKADEMSAIDTVVKTQNTFFIAIRSADSNYHGLDALKEAKQTYLEAVEKRASQIAHFHFANRVVPVTIQELEAEIGADLDHFVATNAIENPDFLPYLQEIREATHHLFETIPAPSPSQGPQRQECFAAEPEQTQSGCDSSSSETPSSSTSVPPSSSSSSSSSKADEMSAIDTVAKAQNTFFIAIRNANSNPHYLDALQEAKQTYLEAVEKRASQIAHFHFANGVVPVTIQELEAEIGADLDHFVATNAIDNPNFLPYLQEIREAIHHLFETIPAPSPSQSHQRQERCAAEPEQTQSGCDSSSSETPSSSTTAPPSSSSSETLPSSTSAGIIQLFQQTRSALVTAFFSFIKAHNNLETEMLAPSNVIQIEERIISAFVDATRACAKAGHPSFLVLCKEKPKKKKAEEETINQSALDTLERHIKDSPSDFPRNGRRWLRMPFLAFKIQLAQRWDKCSNEFVEAATKQTIADYEFLCHFSPEQISASLGNQVNPFLDFYKGMQGWYQSLNLSVQESAWKAFAKERLKDLFIQIADRESLSYEQVDSQYKSSFPGDQFIRLVGQALPGFKEGAYSADAALAKALLESFEKLSTPSIQLSDSAKEVTPPINIPPAPKTVEPSKIPLPALPLAQQLKKLPEQIPATAPSNSAHFTFALQFMEDFYVQQAILDSEKALQRFEQADPRAQDWVLYYLAKKCCFSTLAYYATHLVEKERRKKTLDILKADGIDLDLIAWEHSVSVKQRRSLMKIFLTGIPQ